MLFKVITFLILLLLNPASLLASTLQLGAIELNFPKGWTFNQNTHPIEGTGPYGETLFATVRAVSDLVETTAIEDAKRISETLFIEAHKKMMVVDRVRQRNWLQDEGVAYSSVAQKRLPVGGTVFLLQYLLAYDKTLIYITVEGTGGGKSKSKGLEEVMQNITLNLPSRE